MCAGFNFQNESLIHEKITRSRCFISSLKYFVKKDGLAQLDICHRQYSRIGKILFRPSLKGSQKSSEKKLGNLFWHTSRMGNISNVWSINYDYMICQWMH